MHAVPLETVAIVRELLEFSACSNRHRRNRKEQPETKRRWPNKFPNRSLASMAKKRAKKKSAKKTSLEQYARPEKQFRNIPALAPVIPTADEDGMLDRGWEWATWEYRDAIERLYEKSCPILTVRVGQVRDPEVIQSNSDRCIAYFLTEEVIETVSKTQLGSHLFGSQERQVYLQKILKNLEVWEGSRGKELLESGRDILTWKNDKPSHDNDAYCSEFAEAICRMPTDHPLKESVVAILKAWPKRVRNISPLRQEDVLRCLVEIENLFIDDGTTIGTLVENHATQLIVWVSGDLPSGERLKTVERVVKVITEKNRDIFLSIAAGKERSRFNRLLAQKRLRTELETRLHSLDHKKLCEQLSRYFERYLYSHARIVNNDSHDHDSDQPIIDVPVNTNGASRFRVFSNETSSWHLKDDTFATQLVEAITQAFDRANSLDRASLHQLSTPLVATTGALSSIFHQIERAAAAGFSTLLITGEPGTGKSQLARFIHEQSDRRAGPFETVDCGLHLTPELIQSELFGYEPGSFTGASNTLKQGPFELATNGTVFIDEIGDLAFDLQKLFLRLLQERRFKRVGGVEDVTTNAQVILATNADLDRKVANGTFRQDLLSRISGIHIRIPPLRERRGDIKILAQYFLELYNKLAGKDITKIDNVAVGILGSYDWPNNVRELQQCIENAVRVCDGDTISSTHLQIDVPRARNQISEAEKTTLDNITSAEAQSNHLPLKLDELLLYYVWQALTEEGGNQTRAADRLGITRNRIRGFVKELKAVGADFSDTAQPPWSGKQVVANLASRISADYIDEHNRPDNDLAEALLRERAEAGRLLEGIERQSTIATMHFHAIHNSQRSFDELEIEFCSVPGLTTGDAEYLSMADGVVTQVPAFQISKTPITVSQYSQFVSATGHSPPQGWHGGIPPSGFGNHPVTGVVWTDLLAFATWAGRILHANVTIPSDAQWLAAFGVGVDGRKYPWGNEWIAGACNSSELGLGMTTSVFHFSDVNVSPFGCVDMLGNVWEWTTAKTNDRSPHAFAWRESRGGAYYSSVVDVGVRLRTVCYPGHFLPVQDLGFRVVIG